MKKTRMITRGKKKAKETVKDMESSDDESSTSSTGEEQQGLEEMERMAMDSDGGDEEDEIDSSDEDGGDDDATSEETEPEGLEEEEEEDAGASENTNADAHHDKEENTNTMTGEEKCTLDLRNLLAINSHQVDSSALYITKKNRKESISSDVTAITIDAGGSVNANEEHLLQKASEGCAQLISGLWKLETERSDAGPLAVLPSYFEVKTPRALPPPEPKAETKWEKFAKERGIAPKEKRSRKVWDEEANEWAYRTGYQKASSEKEWPIMEVKGNDNPYEDPWQKARDAKKARVDKNVENRMRNAERAGALAKGTTTRTLKAQKAARESGRKGGEKDLHNIPAGVPVDLKNEKQRGMALTKAALLATQRSTASMGKFDRMREGEPERKKALAGLKKRKFESSTDKKVVKSEASKSMKVLNSLMSGGGSGGAKDKERAIRRGEYAKGETGHDYDFDDGLSGSSYKKKKGRAGMGKMRKVTKKRAK